MTQVLLENARVFDGVSADTPVGNVLVADGRIVDLSTSSIRSESGVRVDVGGRTLMPGLIDAHVHVYYPEVDWAAGDRLPITAVAHWARRLLEGCLARGFTSVRDTGGADYGLALAIARGWVRSPRLFFCGRALSQTGGHGDIRRPHEEDLCTCGGYSGHCSRVADGVDAVRLAIREELRRGAHFIKVMGSGGVSSTGDSLDTAQYSDDELLAAVDETRRHGTYVTAHVHPDAALRRAIELGLPCIEHGTLVTEETAALAAERGTAIVPTLAVVKALALHGKDHGLPQESLDKLAFVEPYALRGVELMHRAGVRIGFGTDLIGPLDRHQATEFTIRREILEPLEILRQATSVNAEIINEGTRLGRVQEGYLADLIVVDGDPLQDVSLFDETGSRVPFVMKAGEIVVNRL
jgi:imidazolonepropionase-like amidohydrolase